MSWTDQQLRTTPPRTLFPHIAGFRAGPASRHRWRFSGIEADCRTCNSLAGGTGSGDVWPTPSLEDEGSERQIKLRVHIE
jgi:hypothetical protein